LAELHDAMKAGRLVPDGVVLTKEVGGLRFCLSCVSILFNDVGVFVHRANATSPKRLLSRFGTSQEWRKGLE